MQTVTECVVPLIFTDANLLLAAVKSSTNFRPTTYFTQIQRCMAKTRGHVAGDKVTMRNPLWNLCLYC